MSVYSDLPLFGGLPPEPVPCACRGSESKHPIWPMRLWCVDCLAWARGMAGRFALALGAAPGPTTLADTLLMAERLRVDREAAAEWFYLREARL